DEMLVGGGTRGQGEPAVAHHHGGDTVEARRGPKRIPEDLSVHVGVAVDETGCDNQAVGVDDLASPLADAADRLDPAVPHPDVGRVRRQTGSVDHHPVLDHQVKRHRGLLSSPGLLSTWAISYYECGADSGRLRVEMKQRLVSIVVAGLVALLVAGPAYAGGGPGGGGHGGGHGGHHGGHHHFHHRGRVFIGFVPFYAYPYWWDYPEYYYYPPAVIEAEPPVYIQQQPG